MFDADSLASKAMQTYQPITDAEAREVVDAMLRIIRDERANYRAKCAAARQITAVRKTNLEAIKAAFACEMEDMIARIEALEGHHEQAGD